MKLLGTTLVALAAGLGPARAQSWQLGARAGLAVSGLAGQNASVAYQDRLGGSAGVFARWQPGRHFSLQPELLYTLGGYRYQYVRNHAGDLSHIAVDLHYLSLPLLAAYRWRGAFLEAGPQVSWLMRAQQRGTNSSYTTSYNVTDSHPGFEAGAAVGAGWQQPRGLLLGLRYTRGLTELLPSALFGYFPARYSESLQLYAGYTFGRATAAGR